MLGFFSPLVHSTGIGEEHRSGRGRSSLQRKGQKDPKAQNYLLEFTAPGSEPEVSTDPVLGVAGAGRAGSLPRSHADTGKSLHRHQGAFTHASTVITWPASVDVYFSCLPKNNSDREAFCNMC